MRKLLRYCVLSLLGTFSRPSKEIHILNMHYVEKIISQKSLKNFEDFIIWLQSIGEIISLEKGLDLMKSSRLRLEKPLFVLTFDDGFEEMFTIVHQVLSKYNLKAAFFINSGFIGSDEGYRKEFASRVTTLNKSPMSWSMVGHLAHYGHVIGAHTLDHTRLVGLSKVELENQVYCDKQLIAKKTGTTIDYFAWPYGKDYDCDEDALKFLNLTFKGVFSSDNYTNYTYNLNRVISRRHIEPYWRKSHIKYFLSKKRNHVVRLGGWWKLCKLLG